MIQRRLKHQGPLTLKIWMRVYVFPRYDSAGIELHQFSSGFACPVGYHDSQLKGGLLSPL